MDYLNSYTVVQVEAALCAWEYMLELRSATPDDEPFARTWDGLGSVEMRHVALRIGPWIDEAYGHVPEDVRDTSAYDWYIVPALVRLIAWEPHEDPCFRLPTPADAAAAVTTELRAVEAERREAAAA